MIDVSGDVSVRPIGENQIAAKMHVVGNSPVQDELPRIIEKVDLMKIERAEWNEQRHRRDESRERDHKLERTIATAEGKCVGSKRLGDRLVNRHLYWNGNGSLNTNHRPGKDYRRYSSMKILVERRDAKTRR